MYIVDGLFQLTRTSSATLIHKGTIGGGIQEGLCEGPALVVDKVKVEGGTGRDGSTPLSAGRL